MPKSQSLTISYPTGVNVVHSNCFISVGYDPKSPPDPLPQAIEFGAIWDTGASASVITQEVVDKLGLVAMGMTKVHGVAGETTAEQYLVNIMLMKDVEFHGFTVTKGILAGGPGVLIGMDVIGKGDFAITNLNNKTCMTYRYPSCVRLDFVEEHRRKERLDAFVAAKTNRNGAKKPRGRKRGR